MVHNWAADKTTQEIIGLAAAFRIPVAPIATPARSLRIDHFVDRGVFVEAEQGVQPRVPYRSDAMPPVRRDHHRSWARTPGRCTGHREPTLRNGDANVLPLSGIRVMDLTAFWAGPVATQVLASLGADVIKVEGVSRPDGMRFAGGRPPTWDLWWEWGPVFLCSNTNKRGVSIELSVPQGRALVLDLVAECDLVVENFSPRVMGNFDLEWDAIKAANPHAVMVRMPAFGLDGPWRDRVGFAQTMEQATGMAWVTGLSDGPPIIPRGVCDPVAGLHAAFAAVAGLVVRDRDGEGMQIESTMVEAALNIAAEMVLEYTQNGVALHREGNRGPGASPQGVYRCHGEDVWLALAVLDDVGVGRSCGTDRPSRAWPRSRADKPKPVAVRAPTRSTSCSRIGRHSVVSKLPYEICVAAGWRPRRSRYPPRCSATSSCWPAGSGNWSIIQWWANTSARECLSHTTTSRGSGSAQHRHCMVSTQARRSRRYWACRTTIGPPLNAPA